MQKQNQTNPRKCRVIITFISAVKALSLKVGEVEFMTRSVTKIIP